MAARAWPGGDAEEDLDHAWGDATQGTAAERPSSRPAPSGRRQRRWPRSTSCHSRGTRALAGRSVGRVTPTHQDIERRHVTVAAVECLAATPESALADAAGRPSARRIVEERVGGRRSLPIVVVSAIRTVRWRRRWPPARSWPSRLPPAPRPPSGRSRRGNRSLATRSRRPTAPDLASRTPGMGRRRDGHVPESSHASTA